MDTKSTPSISRARLRRPVVAGYLYPKAPHELRQFLDACEPAAHPAAPARGVIVPHASYARSGRIAGETLRATRIPRQCLLIGPHHDGSGQRWSLMIHGTYHTPLGDVPVDTALANALQHACSRLRTDEASHQTEYALEVVVPFLQAWGPPELSLVPVLVSGEDDVEIREVAGMIAPILRQTPEPVLVVASADLSAHMPDDATRRADAELLRHVRALRGGEVLRCARDLRLASCGPAPIACALELARLLGGQEAQILRYGTSADTGGDPGSATGYAGVLLN